MNRFLSAVALVVLGLAATSASAQQATNPIRTTWVPTTVTDWQTAASALVASGGDGTVIVLPTGQEAHPWVILRRVEEGSVYVPDSEIHACDVFASPAEAVARFAALDGCRRPMLLVAPDGRQVMLSLRGCDGGRRRAVGR